MLVAEDSDGFYFMVQRAFAAARLPHMLRRVRDGAEALSYVIGRDRFEDRQHFPFPDLIVAESVDFPSPAIQLPKRYVRFAQGSQPAAGMRPTSRLASDQNLSPRHLLLLMR